MAPTSLTLVARIRAYARNRGWAKSRLAAEAGLQDTTLRHFDEAGWNPTLLTLRKLEAIIPADFEPGDVVVTPSAPARPGEQQFTPARAAELTAAGDRSTAELTQAADEERAALAIRRTGTEG